ncbi:MAG: 16S rRNA (guanine(527)-N(7))-methyltransferase RsmG [Pseudobdellovibrionaceae bacterium]
MEKPEKIVNHWRIGVWFPDLNPEVLNQFKIFNDELIKFNKTVNLVPPKTIPMADALHFADSIMVSRVIHKDNPKINEIYDLGSGGGFPGLVFAILYPGVKVHLVETDQNKREFLKHIISTAKINNADIANLKIEEFKDNSMQYVMSRGSASVSKLILLTRRLVPKGGAVYHLRGEQWGIEVSEIPIQLCSSWSPSLVSEYRLPVGEMKFAIIKTDKIS